MVNLKVIQSIAKKNSLQSQGKEKSNTKNSKINLRLIIDQIEEEEPCYNIYNNNENNFKYDNNLCLREEEYILDNEKIQHSNDKIMRSMLKSKVQAAVSLNKWLNIKEEYKVKADELEEVTESYITKTWDDRITDILYKDKTYEGVFYLIEHQTQINYEMVQRIEEYKNEIRRNYERNNKNNRNKKEYIVAKVIAIVLYTGEKEWDAAKSISELEAKCPRIKAKELDDYKLISSKDFTIEELKEDSKNNEEDVLSKIFLINKIGQLGNLNQVEKELDKLVLANNQIGYIAAYINNIIKDKYGEETAKLMVKLIQEKVNKEKKEDKDMLLEAFVDTFMQEGERRGIEKGEKRGEKRGIKQGISQVAINMLKEKCDKKVIKKCTGLSDKQITELEKSLQSA